MRAVVRKIDLALSQLYELDASHRADQYLLRRTQPDSVEGLEGALLIKNSVPTNSVLLAIYLSDETRRALAGFRQWPRPPWPHDALKAFTVAVEEVSHFRRVVFAASEDRLTSRLEMELQGEIDKFIVAYLGQWGATPPVAGFEQLYAALFEDFHFAPNLSPEDRVRYEKAHALARRFVERWGHSLGDPNRRSRFLRWLRRFYRMEFDAKIHAINGR